MNRIAFFLFVVAIIALASSPDAFARGGRGAVEDSPAAVTGEDTVEVDVAAVDTVAVDIRVPFRR